MLRFIQITGDSLSPEYQEGDFVLIARFPFFFNEFRPGAVIVFRHVAYGTLIKKIAKILEDGTYYVTGDHEQSLDSRKLGPIRQEDILGKVIWHIARPRGRV